MASGKSVKDNIFKFALKNALDYGKAIDGAVISKAIAADPSLKSDMKGLVAEVRIAVSEVNAMGAAELEKAFA
ncbi:MAG: hypothetical protein KGH50_02260, partial [Candidatus Micrarchaeota archaeon]|nr:hypothetical protein [Candidatus Micrarchaeota archaeon]